MTIPTDPTAIIEALRMAKARIAFLQAAYCKDKVTTVRVNDEVVRKIDTALAALQAKDADEDD
jgi:hypothetical protein